MPLYLVRQGAQGPNAQRLGEVMLTLLSRSGLDKQSAGEAQRVLIIYTIGFAAFAARPWTEAGSSPKLGADEIHVNFMTGLAWVLSGILQTTSAEPAGQVSSKKKVRG